jgi:hypothetical protein
MQDEEDAKLLRMLNDAQGVAKSKTTKREQRKERKAARSNAAAPTGTLNAECDDDTVAEIIERAKARVVAPLAPQTILEDEELEVDAEENDADACVIVGGGALISLAFF